MALAIRISLALRLAALLAMPLAVLTSVILERSPIIILLLAAALVLVRPVVLRAVKQVAPAWPSFNKLAVKFAGLAILGTVLFVAFAGIGALFTEIDLESRLTGTDAAIILAWTAFAAICLAIPVRFLDGMVGQTSHQMNIGPFGFNAAPGENSDGDEGEIIEGEVIRSETTEPHKRNP
jgi:hypothetical protein